MAPGVAAAFVAPLAGCGVFGGGGPEPVPVPAVSSPPASVEDPAEDPELARYYDQTVDWTSCGSASCGTMTVPLDWTDPAGEVLELKVAVHRATGERLGSLAFNPGGPGVGAVDYVAQADRVVGGDLLEHFDFVAFDPRGTGGSEPIDCIGDAEMDHFLEVDTTPDDAAELREAEEVQRAFWQGCLERSGDRVRHVDTLSVVRDLDVLRAVMGDGRLNFLGKSYGTFLGAWYAELFPWRVGRMVLDGAVDPSADLAAYAAGQAEGFDRGLVDYLEWCLDRRGCPFRGSVDDARAQLGALVAGADAQPLATEDGDRELTQSLMTTGIAQGLYVDSLWQQLNQAIDAALDGDGSGLLELADMYDERTPEGSYGGVLEANPAMFCLDHAETRSAEQIGADADVLAEEYPPLGGFIGWGALGCAESPVEAVVPARRLTAEGAAPILVVGTVGDPATPYEWAQALADQLESGRLLTWEGSGHTAYHRAGSCIDDAVEAYLIAGEVPAEGTDCPA